MVASLLGFRVYFKVTLLVLWGLSFGLRFKVSGFLQGYVILPFSGFRVRFARLKVQGFFGATFFWIGVAQLGLASLGVAQRPWSSGLSILWFLVAALN